MRASIANFINIPEYSKDQVFEILNERAEQALERYSYSEDVIRKIAEKCNSNVAFGMSVLKALALKAESEGKSSIEDLDTELKSIDCPDERLSLDEKVILKILGEWKSLPAGRLYDFYKAKSKHSKSERSFRNYMQKLCEKGLVRSFGEKRGRIYEVVGDTYA
jgi:Cdc6-like AAA superfamily ATPase